MNISKSSRYNTFYFLRHARVRYMKCLFRTRITCIIYMEENKGTSGNLSTILIPES